MNFIASGCLETGRQRTPARTSAASEPQKRGVSKAVLRHTPLEKSTSVFSAETIPQKKQNRILQVPEPAQNLHPQKNECKCFVIFLQNIFHETCLTRVRYGSFAQEFRIDTHARRR
jgi:hypothetical protein